MACCSISAAWAASSKSAPVSSREAPKAAPPRVAGALTRAGLVARLSVPLPGMVSRFKGVPPF
ncbi:hypothetical protein A6P55_25595 (plasmid) [Pandoraea pnomenusa]|nr:hypothetical protein A6P55_25595 [Pandoraea pnomenusa]